MIDFVDAYDNKWDKYIKEIGEDLVDIYYTKEYCRLYENEKSKAYLFVYEEENNIGLYPVMLTQICIPGYEEYFDIETPYGYGGPVVKINDSEFNIRFENKFIEFCIDKNIIAEFIRFHPLIKNERIFKCNIEVLYNRTTVYVNLNKDIDDIWRNDICSKNRNMIRKAEKNGLKVKEISDYEKFIPIYNETMKKVNADCFYYFDEDYYKKIFDMDNIKLFVVEYEERIVAGAIFMGYKKYFHYHLAGSLKEYLKFSPNNLLLWNAIKYSKEKGYEYFHLGGGLTNSNEDNLYRFKQKFSLDNSSFYIGKRIHNEKIYKELIKLWESKCKKKANLLLQYRNY